MCETSFALTKEAKQIHKKQLHLNLKHSNNAWNSYLKVAYGKKELQFEWWAVWNKKLQYRDSLIHQVYKRLSDNLQQTNKCIGVMGENSSWRKFATHEKSNISPFCSTVL